MSKPLDTGLGGTIDARLVVGTRHQTQGCRIILSKNDRTDFRALWSPEYKKRRDALVKRTIASTRKAWNRLALAVLDQHVLKIAEPDLNFVRLMACKANPSKLDLARLTEIAEGLGAK